MTTPAVIGLDLRLLNTPNFSGIAKYAYRLAQEFAGFDSECYKFIGEFCGRRLPQEIDRVPLDLPMDASADSQKLLTLAAYMEGCDLLFSPYFPIPLRRTCRGVFTIHDLIPLRHPEWFAGPAVKTFFDTSVHHGALGADHLIADSYSTKNDIMEFFNLPSERISVVYLAPDPLFSSKKESNLDTVDLGAGFKYRWPYILSTGTLEPRKNMLRTLKAYELIRRKFPHDPMQLILCGDTGWKYEALIRAVNESPFYSDIILTGFISDEVLATLYGNARVFVYPSLYEGFGLPVVEAMAAGAPVVTSRISSIPEVGGDAVYYCDPYDPESIAQGIVEVLEDQALRLRMRADGKKRASLFSWRKSAEAVRTILLACLGANAT